MKKPKALVLFSGGLDSILAVKILQAQNVKVIPLCFKSYFFNEKNAKKAAEGLGIKIKVVDISEEHLEMVKNPKYGFGSSRNPCLDCRLMMLKKLGEFAGINQMPKFNSCKFVSASGLNGLNADKTDNKNSLQKYDFVATGEVLGQRPMTQNKKSLEFLEKESGLSGYLLRPLSAKLLAKTIPEQKGLINREKLFDIFGRSRKTQIALAKKRKIKNYPSPAGGCLLTDLEFGKRLKKLFKKCPKCNGNDIELLKFGRHFWCNPRILRGSGLGGTRPPARSLGRRAGWAGINADQKKEGVYKIIIGRDEQENKEIKKLALDNDILIELKNYPGPLTLVRNYNKKIKVSKKVLAKAKELTQYYSIKARNKKDVEFVISN